MEYLRHGRTVVPSGGIFEDVSSAIQFCEEFESDPIIEKVQELKFGVNEEGYLQIFSEGNPYFLTPLALKEFCKMLKLPFSFINKFPISGLVLQTVNDNPYLLEDVHLVRLIVWKWENREVVTGVLSPETSYMPITQYLGILSEEEVFEREETKLDSILITGEKLVLYFSLPEELKREGFSFHPGFAIHTSCTQASNTEVFPFYQMAITTKTGELFDFDFESAKKLQTVYRKKADFEEATLELSTQYVGEDLGIDLENTIKKGMMARELSSLKFSVVKSLKTRAASTFNYLGMKVQTGAVVEEVIPEYKEFLETNRDLIKHKEKYQTNTMLVDFFLPIYCNRLFTFRSSNENPYFFYRYRRIIGKILDDMLEEIGDVVVPD